MVRSGHRLLFLVAPVLVGLLSGCEGVGSTGRSNVADELLRIQGEKGVALISSGPERAVFAVRGARVVVAPPKGYCIDEDAIELTARAALTLVADCLNDHQAMLAQQSGSGNVVAISLPRSFPGILTISISAELTLKPGQAGLDGFAQALAGPSGPALLARSNGDGGRVVEMQQIGGAVYVMAEVDGASSAIFAPRFWRAFTTVSGRLLMVTVSSFSDRPAGEQGMLSFLASAVAALRQANGAPEVAEETRLAGSLESTLAGLPSSGAEAGAELVAVIRTDTAAQLSDGTDPTRAPLPPVRRRGGGGAKSASAQAAASQAAASQAAASATPAPRPVIAVNSPAASAASPAGGAASGTALAPLAVPLAPVKPR